MNGKRAKVALQRNSVDLLRKRRAQSIKQAAADCDPTTPARSTTDADVQRTCLKVKAWVSVGIGNRPDKSRSRSLELSDGGSELTKDGFDCHGNKAARMTDAAAEQLESSTEHGGTYSWMVESLGWMGGWWVSGAPHLPLFPVGHFAFVDFVSRPASQSKARGRGRPARHPMYCTQHSSMNLTGPRYHTAPGPWDTSRPNDAGGRGTPRQGEDTGSRQNTVSSSTWYHEVKRIPTPPESGLSLLLLPIPSHNSPTTETLLSTTLTDDNYQLPAQPTSPTTRSVDTDQGSHPINTLSLLDTCTPLDPTHSRSTHTPAKERAWIRNRCCLESHTTKSPII